MPRRSPALLPALACLLCLAPATTGVAAPDAVHLVRNGASGYLIHLPSDAPPGLRATAAVLQHYLRRISGATLPVLDGEAPPARSIAFALDPAARDADSGRPFGRDGFRIRAADEQVTITAATPRGARNAVYTFLETWLGCRKYSVDVDVVPRAATVTLPAIDDTEIPLLARRLQDFRDPAYNAWHKLDTPDEWGLFVHTFKDLVPPERYFADHPEYFSENRGVRVADGQLCLSNPDVFRIVVAELRRRMAERPEARFWSVSQNDTYLPCGCALCRAVDEAEGSPSGSLLRFVNRVAAEFPDKVISTLAYQYSRAAPKLTKPAPNVTIMLCSIESDRSRPIAAGGDDGFVKDLDDWHRIAPDIFLWDYVIQFRNLVSPFPNLRVLQPNLQFFVEHGASAVFEQGLRDMHGEFAELRAYLLAKLLWNPYADADSLMDDFLGGFYGDAAPSVREYIDTMHEALARSGEGLSCFGYPFPSADGTLSPPMIARYVRLFDQAEAAVAAEPDVLVRVQTARLPLQYARLEQARMLADGDRGCFGRDAAGARAVSPWYAALLDTFGVRCRRGGITRLWEHGLPPEEYDAVCRAFLAGGTAPHLAVGAPVTLAEPASGKYHDGDAAALTDGLDAWNDYHTHWLGFEGEDMTATVDLGRPRTVSRIATAFLQDRLAWIFLPVDTEFELSEDGEHFTAVGRIAAPLPAEHEGAVRVPESVEFAPRRARFVRVRAENMKTCPAWHKGAGGKAWVFCDEIRVF